jgi:CubicO group peptidase (beta-lactamase class C family)
MIRKEFERILPEAAGIPSSAIMHLLDKLESGYTEPHGLMIMRGGKVCAEGWWTPYAPGIRHGLQSHTKTYAATAVGIAYTEGIVKLDERIIDIFPEYAPAEPSENLKKLTVHHVLCMGCGMDTMPRPSVDWIREFLAVPVVHEPGTTYMYNSTGSTLLGAIVRKKTGLGLHEYLKPRLFDKIGIDASNLRWYCMPDGMEIGGGGLLATTEDNLRLMKLYADGGVWNGERILAEDYVKLATTLQNESASESKVNPPAKDNFVGYGYQIWMCRPKGVYRADGAMGQFTIVVPDRDMLIAITENAAGSTGGVAPQQTLDYMWEFLDEIPAGKGEPIPAGPEQEALLKRMKALALPKPPFAPFSPLQEKVNGRTIKFLEGRLAFGDMSGIFMGGNRMPDGISDLSFSFDGDLCRMDYTQEGEKTSVTVAMNGGYADNTIGGGIVTRALASGAWVKENVFRLTLRWIETCHERKYDFTFDGDDVRVEQVDAPRFAFMKEMAPVRGAFGAR